jgi:simple sugar transport system permease protein
MTAATTALSNQVSRWRGHWWVNALFGLFALVIGWFILNLIIGGQCDAKCVEGTLSQTLRLATPIAFAALCGVICERSGVVNIGIEGQMMMSAMVCYAVNIFSFQAMQGTLGPEMAGNVSRWLAMGAGMLSALLLGMLHSVVSIKFLTDQIISGTVVNMLALGITGYMYRQFLAENIPAGPGTFPTMPVPVLSQIPVVGPILFQQKPLVYIMLILVVVAQLALFRTRWGLRTRAVGEHPRAADTLGINVYRTRYTAVWVGSLIAGLGGAWFTLEAVDVFNPAMTNGLGFIGLAAMIFGKWMPFGALLGALIFGLGSSVTTTISIFRPDIPSQIPQMLPYILTMAVLAGVMGRATPPAADGQPYQK